MILRLSSLAAVLFACLLAGCESEDCESDLVIEDGRLDLLSDEPLLLPCSLLDGRVKVFKVERWDLIFLGWKFTSIPDDRGHPIAAAIPGPYDHVMMYLGKDGDGMGYIAELTTAPGKTNLIIEGRDVFWEGQLYIRALGTDELRTSHESAERFFNGSGYNHATVRALTATGRSQLNDRAAELFDRIRADFLRKIRFQIPIVLDIPAMVERQEITLDDDGYDNGSFCVDYWTDLYEKIGGICLRNSRMNAAEITDYFLTDPDAAYAVISSGQNPAQQGELDLAGFAQSATLIDPPPHVSPACGYTETGVVTPGYLLVSPDLADPIELPPSGTLTTILPLPME